MPESLPQPRTIKIFLASPSDVVEERDALSRVVREINDVLAYLAPEKHLNLELVRYETHAYPDIGPPQSVINRQIPLDYDILVGVMWSRCGTPTERAASGTIEEFQRASERRKQSHLPRIMFYFCDEPIPIPDLAGLDQLTGVVKFRKELTNTGYTWTYPSHGKFAEYARQGLLLAMRDILLEKSRVSQVETIEQPPQPIDSKAQAEILALASEYERVRREMPAGGARTSRMAAIFSEMRTKAPGVQALAEQFEQSSSPGSRLAAIAILQMFPTAQHLDWLGERLDPNVEKPFVGYQAAVALLEAARSLSSQYGAQLKSALSRARTLAQKLPSDTDRINVLKTAEEELQRRFPV